MRDLSIVTVCMNRREHLLATAPRVAAWPHHGEHLIVDWSSTEPVRREELPADPRIRLLRVEGESRWNLCRAYNFAVARCSGEWVLKLDADVWPTRAFDPFVLAGRLSTEVGSICAFGHGPEGRKGQFLMARQLFQGVGGFNEFLVGYGFDDKDLRARLEVQKGIAVDSLPREALEVIEHSDEERMGQPRARQGQALRRSLGLATLRASRLANRLLAAHHPWGRLTPHCLYTEDEPGRWRVLPASIPQPSLETADEIDHARRLAFWSCFLAIPEVFLAELPIKLVPHPRRGEWPVRWWHRLWWHTGRRLLHGPVVVLSWTRGCLGS
jgi:hypothetical protein